MASLPARQAMKICPRCKSQFDQGIQFCPKDGARLTSPSKLAQELSSDELVAEDDLVGRTIAGRYEIKKRLGEGGMGVVYSAVDERLEKNVAIKVLKDDFAKRQDVVARFTQEAKSAAR